MGKNIIPVSAKLFSGFFALIAFFLFLIAIFVNSTYAEVLKENEVKYNLLATNKTKTQFDITITLIQNTTSSLTNNKNIQQFLSEVASGKTANPIFQTEVKNLLSGILEMQSFIENIHVMGMNDQLISATDSSDVWRFKNNYEEYIQKVINRQGTEFWSGGNAHPLFYIVPVFQSNPRQAIGLVVLDIDYDFVRKMFMSSAILANERVLVVNSQGQIIFSFPHHTSYDPFLDDHPEILQHDQLQVEAKVYGQDTIIVTETINMSDWKIVRLINKNEFTKDTKRLSAILRKLLVISCFAGLVYSFWLSRLITKPIRKLADACKKAEKGDLSIQVEIRSRDELGSLGKTFNMMIAHLKSYLEKEIQEEKRKAQMQFQILQAQVNPHFLYNTLDSIKWMAIMQNTKNIAEMSTALIHLLKYNLAPPDAMTTLQEEVESVRHYIRIQRFRYSDNFDFSTHLDPQTLDCVVLRFILQPLVENCIIHGFDDVEKSYQIRISSFLESETLHIKIIDNGSGMNSERIRAVNDGLKPDDHYNHIGIQNIRERIKLYFGQTYDLVYSSEPDVGTIAEIILPLQYAPTSSSSPPTEEKAEEVKK